MNNLQMSLAGNATFSILSGLGLIFLHKKIAELFHLQNSTVFWVIGLGLLFFAITIIIQIKKQNRKRVLFIIVQDLLWVVGSLFLLVLNPFSISSFGNTAIGIVAGIVLLFAISRYRISLTTSWFRFSISRIPV